MILRRYTENSSFVDTSGATIQAEDVSVKCAQSTIQENQAEEGEEDAEDAAEA